MANAADVQGVYWKKPGVLAVKRIPKHRKFLEAAKAAGKRWIVSYGGGGSGKSFSVAQHLCKEAIEYSDSGLNILIAMKTRPALRDSAWALIQDILTSWQVTPKIGESKLDLSVGKSVFHFRGMDNPEKIKSTEYNYIWMEEATSLDWADYLQLKIRLRRSGPVPQQMFMTFNPIDGQHWIWTKVVKSGNPKMAVLHSTWRDNPYLSREYVETLLALEHEDINHYRVYALGEPGRLENIIYTKWNIIDAAALPKKIKDRLNQPDGYGFDWGYAHPMVLLAYWEYEGEDYIQELIYKRQMTTDDLYNRMEEDKIDKTSEIFGPPEQPGVIDYLNAKGYNVKPVPSDCRNVKDGIDYCKGRNLHIILGSDNIIKEIKGYSYKMRKDLTVLDEPVKFNDDGMDAMRYARVGLRAQFQGFVPGDKGKSGDDILKMMEGIICQRNQVLG